MLQSNRRNVTSKRRTLVLCIAFGVVLLLFLLRYSSHAQRMPWRRSQGGKGPLPTYDDIYEMERNLPQHDLALPFPEGKTGRYVKFSNMIYMLGWNNVLSELLLSSHLAWRAKRAYVFQDYAWNPEHFPWKFDGVPHTPINALLAGPTAGGPWSINDNAPRSISKRWFDAVCPPEDTKVIVASDAKDPIRGSDAKKTLEYWVKLLNDTAERCVDVVNGDFSKDNHPQTFDLWTISNENVLPLWEEFRDSPVSRLLRAPPLIASAIRDNEHLFFPSSSKLSHPNARYDSMLAIHLRQGDYFDACKGFSDWNSSFFMWNLLPDLPDPLHRVSVPTGSLEPGKNTAENYEIYRRRCYPTADELAQRIHQVKMEWEASHSGQETLRSLFLMTNAKKDFLGPFVKRMKREGWETIVTSKDLAMSSPEQTAVGMAIDMDIGRQAAVFLGNGWSSLTSNVVHRRLVDGHPYQSCRFL